MKSSLIRAGLPDNAPDAAVRGRLQRADDLGQIRSEVRARAFVNETLSYLGSPHDGLSPTRPFKVELPESRERTTGQSESEPAPGGAAPADASLPGRRTLLDGDPGVHHGQQREDELHAVMRRLLLPGGESDSETAGAVLTWAARTATGRLLGPGPDLAIWREGPRLLADEVLKSVGYAIVRSGRPVVAMGGNEIVVEVAADQTADVEKEIEQIAVAAQRRVLGGLAAPVRLHRAHTW